MICALPILCALGVLVPPSVAHPATNFNKAITPVPGSHNTLSEAHGHGHGHANLTTWPGITSVDATANASTSLDKRGTKWGKYVSYPGDKFMDESVWDYWTRDDPTHGKVNYVSLSRARELGLVGINPQGQFIMAASSTSTSDRGRDSLRIHSRQRFSNYLVILDLHHMPVGKGAWPAFWSNGDDSIRGWPNCGEVDIIEGVHDSGQNQFTIHTARDGSCRLNPSSDPFKYTGTFAAHQDKGACDGNLGCSVRNADERGWGTPLNDHQGGYFVAEFSPRGVYHWFYLRQDWPESLKSLPDQIDTDVFGVPLAAFGGDGCDVRSNFTPQQFIFDITFCGDWLAGEWAGDNDDQKRAQCEGFVMDRNNDAKFRDAYWAINSMVVYTEDGDNGTYMVAALNGGSGASSSNAQGPSRKGKNATHNSSHRPSASCFTLALTLAISLCCL